MSPLEMYQHDVASSGFVYDPKQEQVIHYAQILYQELLKNELSQPSVWQRLKDKIGFSQPPIRGLYIWGGVGRGKTYILNMLYKSLPGSRKKRVHFHQFMQSIHEQLSKLKGQVNPLDLLAAQLASEIKILFIDEFHVQDIADAMLLAGLIKPLFENEIILVTTSNIPPKELYKDGLQRKKFLPAIAQIGAHTIEIELVAGIDYRLSETSNAHNQAESKLKKIIEQEGIKEKHYDRHLAINNRLIVTIAANSSLAWFDFDEICNTTRSTADYLKIAEIYPKVAVSSIPIFNEVNENAALRFIHMIDAFYDFGVEFYYTAEISPEKLYQGRLHSFPFQRTSSRLIEMANLADKNTGLELDDSDDLERQVR